MEVRYARRYILLLGYYSASGSMAMHAVRWARAGRGGKPAVRCIDPNSTNLAAHRKATSRNRPWVNPGSQRVWPRTHESQSLSQPTATGNT